jgi:uncharacterized protein with PIN domain
MSTEPRFLVDAMLGSLAKWLRILGYDAHYSPSLDDHQLVRLARSEERSVLTRDTELVRRRGVRCLLIRSHVLREQLAQVVEAFDLNADSAFTRCPVCNTLLEPASRHEAQGQVPPFVFRNHDRFSLCRKCNRFYWRGTHWSRMARHVAAIHESAAK